MPITDVCMYILLVYAWMIHIYIYKLYCYYACVYTYVCVLVCSCVCHVGLKWSSTQYFFELDETV